MYKMNSKINNEQYIDWVMNNYEKSVRAFQSLRETGSLTEDEYQKYIAVEARKMSNIHIIWMILLQIVYCRL